MSMPITPSTSIPAVSANMYCMSLPANEKLAVALVDCQVPVGPSSPKTASVPAGMSMPGTGPDGSMLPTVPPVFCDCTIPRVQ